MNYLIAVLLDRAQAESAYTALEKQGLSMDKIFIVGKGYRNVEELDPIDPNAMAKKQAKLMASWLIPFGFIGGITFSLLTGLHTFAWAGEIGNHLVGGVLGAIGGAMGGFFIGGGTSIVFKSGDARSYRDRIDEDRYLIFVQGSQSLIQQASRILREFQPEDMESYIDPYTV